ncbi:MAG TPA: hypothetical protein VFF10_02430 [Trueperaceae bacterium]|nr:hypothetical protein [Trueperaceae bacterium]
MLQPWNLALELLEYKVEEYVAKRTVRGGVKTMWELFELLGRDREQLSSDQRRRLDDIGTNLQSASQSGPMPSGKGFGIDDLVIGSGSDVELAEQEAPARPPDSPEEREEHAVLQRLARRVWWDELDGFVQQVAASWRSQRDRYAPRIVYAALQNLRANSTRSTFVRDTSLRGFRVVTPIPSLSDPLVSLSDVDSLSEIARDVINLIMTLGKEGSPYPDLVVPEAQALQYVRQLALAVAADPYAGRSSPIDAKLPSSRQLRLAIQELDRERLPDDERAAQRRALEKRLAEIIAMERNERLSFNRDAAMLQDVVHAFFERLADYLPTAVGGRASGPQLAGGVLFGVNPALRVDHIGPAVNEVTVRLVGPVRLSMGGHDFAFSGAGASRVLFVDDRQVDLERTSVVQLGRDRLAVFREADYVHLRLRDEGRSLAVRLAEALVVLHVLTSPKRDDLMTVAKVIANTVRGEPQELVVQALSRANHIASRAPDRRQALVGLFRGAARATGVDIDNTTVAELVDLIEGAFEADPNDVDGALERSGADERSFHTLTGEPLTVELAGQKITVRQYRGRSGGSLESLVAMLPGQVLGSFTDYLLAPLGSGTLLFVRGDSDLAVLYLSQARIYSTAV